MKEERNIDENILESGLWKTRFIVLLAVIFSILAAIALFIFASYERIII